MMACDGGDGPKDGPTDADVPGIVASVRTLAGDRFLDAQVRAGTGGRADPDSRSVTYFYRLAPGRSAVTAEAEGHAWVAGVPDVRPGALAAADLRPLPLDAEVPFDAAAGGTLAVGSLTVTLDGGSLESVDGDPAGDVTMWTLEVGPDQREGLPGDDRVLSNDDQIAFSDLHHVWFVGGATAEGREVTAVTDALIPYVVTLPASSPLFSVPIVRAATFSRTRGYWSSGATAVVDPVAHTVSFELGGIGWVALVEEHAERSCVNGSVRSGGRPVVGAEIRIARDGLVGVDRVTSDEGGRVCVAGDGPATWSGLGFSPDLTAMYAASGAVELGGTLTFELTEHRDADGDQAWSGPGGDCDDDDPAVSPDPLDGDGSYCGGDW